MIHGSATNGGGGGVGQKPICTICYEDLKPAIEDLQTVPLCGHVFHELCLQQWLEYCPAGKKPTCPVCKQSCTHDGLIRLYFQSTGGDPTQLSQRPPPSEADVEELAEEVKRLEGKISSLNSSLKSQHAHLTELNDELSLWKELAKKEAARAEEIKKEKECADKFLQFKLEELSRKTLECTKLEERSLGLAKELAALKLATDLNLSEEEMVKLASLGHGKNPNNAIDVLRKSLALRNKSYKELMVQCNLLGRSESRALQKLDKAKEKMAKVKARVQELEKSFEGQQNGILRNLKASTKMKLGEQNMNYVENLGSLCVGNHSLQDQTGSCDILVANPNNKGCKNKHPNHLYQHVNVLGLKKNLSLMNEKENIVDLETDACFLVDKETFECSTDMHKPSVSISDHRNETLFYKNKSTLFSSDDDEAFTFNDIGVADRSLSSNLGLKDESAPQMNVNVKKNVIHISSFTQRMIDDDILKDAHSLPSERDAQAHNSVAVPEDPPFLGGHFGHEGGSKMVGKWCRQVLNKADISRRMRDSICNSGLIATGADGRGGRVKVLRTQDDFLEAKGHSLCPKRHKTGSKQTGQFQIEHFFGKQ